LFAGLGSKILLLGMFEYVHELYVDKGTTISTFFEKIELRHWFASTLAKSTNRSKKIFVGKKFNMVTGQKLFHTVKQDIFPSLFCVDNFFA
jgi:hypothetical protein